jgi:hypothetical protein
MYKKKSALVKLSLSISDISSSNINKNTKNQIFGLKLEMSTVILIAK